MQNANFNVIGLADANGTLVERYEYTPYGQRTVYKKAGIDDELTTAPLVHSQRVETDAGRAPYGLCDVGHQGLMHDEQFGLVYNRNRCLDPRTGRWVQRDLPRSGVLSMRAPGSAGGSASAMLSDVLPVTIGDKAGAAASNSASMLWPVTGIPRTIGRAQAGDDRVMGSLRVVLDLGPMDRPGADGPRVGAWPGTVLSCRLLQLVPPGADAGYLDGMDLYGYGRQRPTGETDPSRLIATPYAWATLPFVCVVPLGRLTTGPVYVKVCYGICTCKAWCVASYKNYVTVMALAMEGSCILACTKNPPSGVAMQEGLQHAMRITCRANCSCSGVGGFLRRPPLGGAPSN